MKKHQGAICKLIPRGHIFIVIRWMLLSLLGWLLYCLTRGLVAFISLGAPFHDWQWYIAVILFLILILARLLGLLPPSSWIKGGIVLLSIWLVAGYFGFWLKGKLLPAKADKIKISYWAGSGIIRAPDRVLNDLHAASGSLYISIGENEFDGEYTQALVNGLRRLSSHDIMIYLAPRASNYVCVPVLDEWIANVRKTANLVQREDLKNVIGIIGDFEKPYHLPMDYWGLYRETLAPAVKKLENFKAEMKTNHPSLNLGVTAFWTLYLDRVDGDQDLAILSRCPVDPPGGWDFINCMTYSSFFPQSWRAYYMYLVERMINRRYPTRSPSYLIGLVGAAGPGEPLMSFDELLRDARLSRSLGIREVVVYQITPALRDFGDDFVQRLDAAVNDAPPDLIVDVPFARPVSLLFYGVLVADSILDVRGWMVFLIFVWIALSGFLVYRFHKS